LSAAGSTDNSGVVMVSFRGDYTDAYVRGYSNLSGAPVLDGDDSDSGEYTLFSGMSGAISRIFIKRSNGIFVQVPIDNGAVTVGELTYNFSYDPAGTLSVVIYGKYNSIGGRVEGSDDSVLTVSNCRVRSMIAGARQDVLGNVVMKLSLVEQSPCNIYGGGNGFSVSGSVFLTINSGKLIGMVYGGSRGVGENVSVGDVNITVSGIEHADNPKLLSVGNSAWLLGGGAAFSGGISAAGNVNISVTDATVGRLVGGGQAQDSSSMASVVSVNISVRNCSVSGDIYGGGYATNDGYSEVETDTNISLYADEDNFLYVYGTIYGGGANPAPDDRRLGGGARECHYNAFRRRLLLQLVGAQWRRQGERHRLRHQNSGVQGLHQRILGERQEFRRDKVLRRNRDGNCQHGARKHPRIRPDRPHRRRFRLRRGRELCAQPAQNPQY